MGPALGKATETRLSARCPQALPLIRQTRFASARLRSVIRAAVWAALECGPAAFAHLTLGDGPSSLLARNLFVVEIAQNCIVQRLLGHDAFGEEGCSGHR